VTRAIALGSLWRPVVLGALFVAVFSPRILHLVRYTWQEDKYSHGYLIPFVSLAWLWFHRERVAAAPRRPANPGVLLVLLGLFGWVIAEGRNFNAVAHVSMLLVIVGMVVFARGWRFFGVVAFPVLYLAFAFPVPKRLDDVYIGPVLQRVASATSAKIIDFLGIPVYRQGNVIDVPGIRLLVEEACSGIHSLYTLAALSTAYVFFTEQRTWERIVLILSTVPIAVAANVFRVTVTGLLAWGISVDLAEGFFHELGGVVVFLTGLALLLAEAALLRKLFPLRAAGEAS
jgi:exosortase